MPSSKNRRTGSLEKIDKNFRTASPSTGLKWRDAFDRSFALRGLGWPSLNRKTRTFFRFPATKPSAMPEAVQILSQCPASVFVAFSTDSCTIGVRMAADDTAQMRHMPASGMAGAELYLLESGEWLPVAVAIPSLENPEFEQVLLQNLTPGITREFRLYLPLYKKLTSLSIGLTTKARVRPTPAPTGLKPIVFYGTSITQGGCASTAGSDFVSLTGRLLNRDTINFGFSGNGKGEPALAKALADIDAHFFVLNYCENSDREGLQRTLPEFVRILRQKRPGIPVVLLSSLSYDGYILNSSTRLTNDGRREAMMEFYLESRKNGDANIHYIDGFGLIPPGTTGAYVDGVHPTSAGFSLIAHRLAPFLRIIQPVD